MSVVDLTAVFNRFLQQVSNGATRAGTWTRGQVLNIRRKRPKSATAATTATTSSTTSTATQKTNGESSKRSKLNISSEKETKKKLWAKAITMSKHKRTIYISSPFHALLTLFIIHFNWILSHPYSIRIRNVCLYICVWMYSAKEKFPNISSLGKSFDFQSQTSQGSYFNLAHVSIERTQSIWKITLNQY